MKRIHYTLIRLGFDLRPGNLLSKPEFDHSVFLGSGQFVVSLLAFALTYVLANFVSEEVVGQYRFILAAYASISVFALGGLTTALTQSVASGKFGSYHEAVSIKWRYGLIGTIAFAALAGYFILAKDHDANFIVALVLAGVALPALETSSLYSAYLSGIAAFRRVAFALVINRLVVSTTVIILALYQPALTLLIGGYFVSQLVVNYFFHRQVGREITREADVDTEMLPYAKHMTAMALVSVLSSQLDKIVLFFFFGPVALASFWVASVLPQEVGRVVSLVVSTFFPRMVRVESVTAIQTVRKLYWLSLAVTLLISFAYSLVDEYIFALFLPNYAEFATMSAVLMFAYAVVPHLFVWNIFTAKKMVKELYWFSIAEPSLTIGLYILFIPVFGVWGLVVSLCVKNLILNIVSILITEKYLVGRV